MAGCGALALAPIEYALTLWAYAGPIELAAKLRLVALTLTLALWLCLILLVATFAIMTVGRLWRTAFDPAGARGNGLFAPSPAVDGVRPGVPLVWTVVATAGVVGVLVQRGAVWATIRYQEAQLRGIVIAIFALAAGALAFPLFRLFRAATRVGADATAPILGRVNPLARWRPAGVAGAALVAGLLTTVWFVLPQSRSVMPTRLLISAVTIVLGMGIGALVELPRLRRSVALGITTFVLTLNVATLWKLGADIETKYVAITGSPSMERLIRLVRTANDLDRDGFGSLLGENDCAPFEKSIHPAASDLPDDGIDQNCDGRDFSLRTTNPGDGPVLPIPDQFKRGDWNVLFITIDTVRYDHTTFGGYKSGPKARDTTPRLAELVKRSTSFAFCNAPSAGTMASIPAIMTSKFFHSGIALDENKPPGTPPGIKQENTTLPEIMKSSGYHTGVIATHHWWNDWGLDQGVDEYDNSIGKTNDPFIVAAHKTTDHVLAWITRQQGRKWFLWAHYIDPHGRYVAHPDVVDYGNTEPDLYDAELRWTDQQVGRLLDELRRLPSDDRTIIVITSDHGESMGEHNIPVGTHGTALYRELLHVPLIFYVPNLPPKQINGAVTPLDIVPTIVELIGADVKGLEFEGKSLVPQIFYAKEEPDRIVFAETNAPSPQRAAISQSSKLIYYLQSNLYELYDLKADPMEKTNLAPKNPPAMALMKTALDAWLERVVYARDQLFNQQASKNLADLVLTSPPKPAVATTGQTLDDGKLTILGLTATPKPTAGAQTTVEVFFKVNARTQLTYKFLLAAWPVDTATWKPTDPAPANLTKSSLRATGEGFFGTERWRTGEFVRDKFTLTIPPDWTGNAVAFGLVAMDQAGEKASATAAAPSNDPNLLVLGIVPR